MKTFILFFAIYKSRIAMSKAMYKARKPRETNKIVVHVTWYEVSARLKHKQTAKIHTGNSLNNKC